MNYHIVITANPDPLPDLAFSFGIVATLRSSFQFRNLPLYAFPYHQHNHHRSDCKIYQVRTSFIGQQANLQIS